MSEYTNGTGLKHTLESLSRGQSEIESILKEGFERTEKSLIQIANEIRQTRESGYIPAPIVEKLLDHQNAMNQKNSDKVYKIISMIFGAVLVVLLGLKAFFPSVLGQ